MHDIFNALPMIQKTLAIAQNMNHRTLPVATALKCESTPQQPPQPHLHMLLSAVHQRQRALHAFQQQADFGAAQNGGLGTLVAQLL
jgi:hypothetical protein